jgi:acyl phosphate:glycerol-3-phosphate acyltransferase
MTIQHILGILGAYLIGSIPSGFLIARARGVADIREHGSGNIGATNVARVLGAQYFFVVFFLDFFKAYAFIITLAHYGCSQDFLLVAGGCLLLGNACSIFLNFRGGKGVATTFGILLAINPLLVLASAVIFLPVLYMTRTVGLASVVTLAALPLIAWVVCADNVAVFLYVVCTALLGIFWHRGNIVQLVTNKKI